MGSEMCIRDRARPALVYTRGTECRPKAEGRHWPALGGRSAGRRRALGTGVPAEGRHWRALGTGVPAEGRHWRALGTGVPGRRPARRCPFGIVCILGSRRILPPFQGFKNRDTILLSPSLNIPSHSTHSVKLAPSVRLSLGHFQCKCSHSPYTVSAKHLKCFAGWALSVQMHEALDT